MSILLAILSAGLLLLLIAVGVFWILFPLGVLVIGLCKFSWQALKGERPWWRKGDMKRIGDKDPTKNWGPM